VKEADAPDYRSIIAGEMYFQLIDERIKSGYYRSQEVSTFKLIKNALIDLL